MNYIESLSSSLTNTINDDIISSEQLLNLQHVLHTLRCQIKISADQHSKLVEYTKQLEVENDELRNALALSQYKGK